MKDGSWEQNGGFQSLGGSPKTLDGFCLGTSQSNMDDDYRMGPPRYKLVS